jgi:hypothetical protein
MQKPWNIALSFTIEIFDDPDTEQPIQLSRINRNREETLDALSEHLEAGHQSDKQMLMLARKLEAMLAAI